jgi:glycine betaine/choline ABC-type transport system substrate-binding protein
MGVKGGSRTAVVCILTALGLMLVGCGLQPATSYVPEVGAGTIEPIPSLGGAKLTVTSKNFTEQLVLGKITVLAAKAAGFDVNDLTNVPGSLPARELMSSGQADVTWEYTGTAWLTYLGNSAGIPEQDAQWKAVHDADLKNGLTWGAPAPLNNTYGLAVRGEAVAKLGGISRLSQIAKLPVKERTFCLEPEFNSRPDGFNPMLKHYGLVRGAADGVPESNIGIYDAGAVYSATAKGNCNFGEVFATDGRIVALNLSVLKDDKKFFPAYNAAPVFLTQTLEKYPQLEGIFAQISPALTDDVMRSLNLKVDVQGEEPVDVAFAWMRDQGFIRDAK